MKKSGPSAYLSPPAHSMSERLQCLPEEKFIEAFSFKHFFFELLQQVFEIKIILIFFLLKQQIP